MSNEIKNVSVIYGVSDQQCNNRKLFDYVEQWQNTDKTLLQFFSRNDTNGKEHFVGIPVQLNPDNTIDIISIVLTQSLWERNEHAQASNTTPKIYFL